MHDGTYRMTGFGIGSAEAFDVKVNMKVNEEGSHHV